MREADRWQRVAAVGADLGESPVWDERRGVLYFVDITAGRICSVSPQGQVQTLYQSTARVGALALTDKGNLIFTEDASVAVLDVQAGVVRRRAAAVHAAPGYRFNDGACDPQGRFVTGLMGEGPDRQLGALYRCDDQLHASLIHQGVALPNGLAWSDDGRTLFFVDSIACSIFRAQYSQQGTLSGVTLFARTPAGLGRPDGIALDQAGGLWVCQFNGGCLLRFDQHGVLNQRLVAPVPRPTSCCFGGDALDTLYVTTARFAMTPGELAQHPDAGDVYALQPDIKGIARHCFKE